MRTYEEYSKLLGPYITNFKKGGSPIHIKKANEGKFTASAKSAGMSVQAYAQKVLNDPNASGLEKKRANFARNAAKWNHKHKHGRGGYIKYFYEGGEQTRKIRPAEKTSEKIDYNINADKTLSECFKALFNSYINLVESYDKWINSNSFNYKFNRSQLEKYINSYGMAKIHVDNYIKDDQKGLNKYEKYIPKLPPILENCRAFEKTLKYFGAYNKYNKELMDKFQKNSPVDIVFPDYNNFYNSYIGKTNEPKTFTASIPPAPKTYYPPDIGEQRDLIFGLNTSQYSTQEPSENTPSSESTASSNNINPYDFYSSQADDYYLSQQLDDPLYDYFNITSRHSYPYRKHSSNRYSYSPYSYDNSSYDLNPYSSSSSSVLNDYFI